MTNLTYLPLAGDAEPVIRPIDKETRFFAYAQASVMLIECLMITLLERGILTKVQVVDAVEDVIAAKLQMMQDEEDSDIAVVATGVLRTMANSIAAAGIDAAGPRRC